MMSEDEVNQWLQRIEKSTQSHNMSFIELQNLITEKRTLLRVLGRGIE